MTKYALVLMAVLFVFGGLNARYELDRNAPQHQYIYLADQHRWIHVNVDALDQAPAPPPAPPNPNPPACWPGGCCPPFTPPWECGRTN